MSSHASAQQAQPHEDTTPLIPNMPPRTTQKKFDKRWIIIVALILFIVVVGVIVNIVYQNNNPIITTGFIDTDNGDTNINWDRYATSEIALSESITITESGVYHLTGTLANGQITINSGSTGKIKLILDNVSITNTTGPAISCVSGDELAIELVGNNTLEDGANYSTNIDEDIKGAVYSKADLTFEGDGTLAVTANYQDAIIGKDDVKFTSGTYSISAADDGIRGKDSVYIVSGDFDIVAKADAIKSTNDTDSGKGFVLIEDGNINISAGDDAIHAERVLTVQSGTVNITKSYEGLESPQIIINGGDIAIISSDDGINAGSSSDTTANSNPMIADENCKIVINNGNIYINASGDGIDSNGWVYFNGGTTIVDGPTNNGNGALDSGAGIVMNGGSVIAVGSNGMAETLGSTSSVFNISVFFSATQKAGTELVIKDSASNTIIAHTSAKAFSHAAIGSTEFSLGSTYSIYLDGVKYQDFTISDTTTTIGNTNSNINMMPGQGRR